MTQTIEQANAKALVERILLVEKGDLTPSKWVTADGHLRDENGIATAHRVCASCWALEHEGHARNCRRPSGFPVSVTKEPNHQPTPLDKLMGNVKSTLAHWREFGPEHGFDEDMDRLARVVGEIDPDWGAVFMPAPRIEHARKVRFQRFGQLPEGWKGPRPSTPIYALTFIGDNGQALAWYGQRWHWESGTGELHTIVADVLSRDNDIAEELVRVDDLGLGLPLAESKADPTHDSGELPRR